MKIVHMDASSRVTASKSNEIAVVKVNPPKRSLIDRLLYPTHVLRETYVEHSGNKYYVALVLDKHSVFGVTCVKEYVETCFPGGDAYRWSTEDEYIAVERAKEYKERIGQVIYV